MDRFKETQQVTPKNQEQRSEQAQIYQTVRLVDKIDKSVMCAIINETLERSGAQYRMSPGQIKVNVAYENKRAASAWHSHGEITINAAKFTFSEDYKKDYRRVFSAFIHDFVHMCAYGEGAESTGFTYVTDGVKINVKINEAFTELVADYLFEEYLRRTGDLKTFGAKVHNRTVKGYIEERTAVNKMMERLAQEYEVPVDIIKNAYIAAYFTRDISVLRGGSI